MLASVRQVELISAALRVLRDATVTNGVGRNGSGRSDGDVLIERRDVGVFARCGSANVR